MEKENRKTTDSKLNHAVGLWVFFVRCLGFFCVLFESVFLFVFLVFWSYGSELGFILFVLAYS